MTVKEIMQLLEDKSDTKRKANVVKMGIPEENSLGVSTGDIRKLAKQLPKDEKLALELWNTKVHEAKLLAILLFDPAKTTAALIEKLMKEIYSWDLCDHFCKNYLFNCATYRTYIQLWVQDARTYYKRAAFTLIATQVIKEKQLSDDELAVYLTYIKDAASTDDIHVYKAISWALREIGKVDSNLQEKALQCAYDLIESEEKDAIRIGKLALRELENLVQVEGRKRLIQNKAKMATEQ